jgi:hypothetical protein
MLADKQLSTISTIFHSNKDNFFIYCTIYTKCRVLGNANLLQYFIELNHDSDLIDHENQFTDFDSSIHADLFFMII